ncbi:putative reverse transcriptase domain-containing protein [Tanacetum coccineum]
MDSQRVDLLMGDRMTLYETVWMVKEESYASRDGWAHSIGLSQATHQELQTHRDHVYAYETHLQAHQIQLQLQDTLIQTQLFHEYYGDRFQMQQADKIILRSGENQEIRNRDVEPLMVTGNNVPAFTDLSRVTLTKTLDEELSSSQRTSMESETMHIRKANVAMGLQDGDRRKDAYGGSLSKKGNGGSSHGEMVVLRYGKAPRISRERREERGMHRSFISTAFSSLINIAPTPLENCYEVELAYGKLVGIDTIIRGCTLNFLDHPFNIDLMPVELGSFDVIIGMDWLRRCHDVIVCDEKLVHVPYGNETLTFCGNKSRNRKESQLTVILCSKAQEYMAKGYQVFLAQISVKKEEDKSEEKQIKDIPIVRDFPEVFLEDLPGLPSA